MGLRPLLFWGLVVWLATISQECNAAAFKERCYSQDEASGPSPSLAGQQGASSSPIEPDINKNKKELQHAMGSYEPLIPVEVMDIPKEQSKRDVKTNPEPDSLISMLEFEEDGTEEEDENGTIRGKYSYVEEDGVPASIEYEATPGMKFVIKSYIKGSKILPVSEIAEHSEYGRALNADDLNKSLVEIKTDIEDKVRTDAPNSNKEQLKTTSTVLIQKEPEYEHASVIGKYNLKATRKTRSIDGQKSELTLAEDSEIKDKIMENEHSKADNGESLIDASYRFGFSADGQTRNEEADAQGNVQGSYSYIGDDGMLTKVEYEAGSGKGFVVKRIVQEDTKKSLPPQSSDSVNQPQSPLKLNAPVTSGQEVKSEDHKIQSPPKVKQYYGKEENENGGKIHLKDDGSYSYSYTTPNQWRKESIDANGQMKGGFSFIIPGRSEPKQPQYEVTSSNGYVDQGFDHPTVDMIEAPKSVLTLPSTNVNINGFNTNNDGSYSFSYETPQQFRSGSEGGIPQRETSSWKQDHSTSEGNIADMFKTSSIENDDYYSNAYEALNQGSQESGNGGVDQGQFSYVDRDGNSQRVNYTLGYTGFVPEGAHLPQSLSDNDDESNTEETKTSIASTSGVIDPTEPKTETKTTEISNKIPSTADIVSPVEEQHDDADFSNEDVNYGGFDSLPSSRLFSVGYPAGSIPQQGTEESPQESLDLPGIRSGVGTNNNGQTHNYRKVIKKRPIEPTPTSSNTLLDGSYSFAYKTKDQLRRERVDTKGNVYSGYQYKTKDNGRTVVVFIRKNIKGSVNEKIAPADNVFGQQIKENIPSDYLNENPDDQLYNENPAGGSWTNRKRQIPQLNYYYDPAQVEPNSPMNSKIETPLSNGDDINSPAVLTSNGENQRSNRRAKSIVKPFRGHVKYNRQIV